MKLSYLIVAHHFPEQLARLVNVLNISDVTFYIHIDKKTEIKPFIEKLNLKNVFFISNRINIYWGKNSVVEAELRLIKEALKSDADSFILLSGVDYPITSNKNIFTFFENNQSEYLSYSYLGTGGWEEAAVRYQKYYANNLFVQKVIDLLGDLIPKRKMPYQLVPYGGSEWWNLTRDCCEYVVQYVNNHPDIMKFFSTTLCPDEMFFQTILLNSHFADRVVNNDLRYVDWSDCAIGNSFSPNILLLDDFPLIKQSGKLFARKFDLSIDSKILDQIDQNR